MEDLEVSLFRLDCHLPCVCVVEPAEGEGVEGTCPSFSSAPVRGPPLGAGCTGLIMPVFTGLKEESAETAGSQALLWVGVRARILASVLSGGIGGVCSCFLQNTLCAHVGVVKSKEI